MTLPNVQADAGEILRTLELLVAPDSVAQLRCPKTERGTGSGYYSEMAAMASEASALAEECRASTSR